MTESLPNDHDYTRAEALLESSDEYRVLKRLDRRSVYADLGKEDIRRGLVLDLETTGLSHSDNRIIELGMVSFTYGAESGNVGEVLRSNSYFEDPGCEIPQDVIDLTGITNEMVAGHEIDDDVIKSHFDTVDLVIAHNAGFDRPFFDKRFDFGVGKPWACSLREVPWKARGFKCEKLECLLTSKCATFFTGHRAEVDCLALLHLLATPFQDEKLPMHLLLASARLNSVRIWATGAPYEAKDALKARGYHWNPGDNGSPKAWWCELSEADRDAEIEWLKDNAYGGRPGRCKVKMLDARTRYTC